MDKLELSDEENILNNEILNEESKKQLENNNNIINNNLNNSDDDIVNNSNDEDKKANLNNSDTIIEYENLGGSSDLCVDNDNIEFDNGLIDLYSNFNDYNIPLMDRLLIKENIREDLKKTIMDYKKKLTKEKKL